MIETIIFSDETLTLLLPANLKQQGRSRFFKSKRSKKATSEVDIIGLDIMDESHAQQVIQYMAKYSALVWESIDQRIITQRQTNINGSGFELLVETTNRSNGFTDTSCQFATSLNGSGRYVVLAITKFAQVDDFYEICTLIAKSIAWTKPIR